MLLLLLFRPLAVDPGVVDGDGVDLAAVVAVVDSYADIGAAGTVVESAVPPAEADDDDDHTSAAF